MKWGTNKRFWYGVATLVGSTVGVGIYGLPFVFQKAGFGVGFLFLIGVGGLVLLNNLLYGEIVLRTHQRHQMIGYTHKYLGPPFRKINLFTFMISVYGALIGIIIISGNFLVNIGSIFLRFSPAQYSTFFVIAAALLVFLGRRTVSRIDFSMMLAVGAIILLITLLGIKRIDPANYAMVSGAFWFLPFGVVLFALNGASGVPLAREAMIGHEHKLKKALAIGTIIPIIFYLIFALAVVGVSGEATTPDAISGLLGRLGHKIVFIGSLLGFMTALTIFLNMATALKQSFQEDFHFKRFWAWFLTIVPPYVLFILGTRNFIDVIGLVGGLAVSSEAIILIFLYAKARKNGDRIPEYSVRIPTPVLYLMMLVFAFGAAYTLLIK